MGQGISRSRGVGFRGGFWRSRDSVVKNDQRGSVVTSGFGGSVYFFSRLRGNIFLETSLGAADKSIIGGGGVESSVLLPSLFGLRFDMLPSRIQSAYQPYGSLGLGGYLIIHSQVGDGVTTEVDGKFSPFVGGGINVLLKNWVALNCDIKYHFVNLNATPMEDFTGLEFGVGLSFMWGNLREIFRIEEIRVVVKDIYPAYYQFYNTYPLALICVKNTVHYPIEINVRSDIKGYSERPYESGFVVIAPGETKDIPIHALFGQKILNVSRREPTVIDIELEAKTGAVQTKSISEYIMIHNRNAWNGEIDKLGFFITPDDGNILQIGRELEAVVSNQIEDESKSFAVARALFDELRKRDIRYRRDPNVPFYKDDRVQFAQETLTSGAGDCDDFVVLFSSLLESVGIQTAFVDVHDPNNDVAHVYMIFNTGVPQEQSMLISSNEKRYIVREARSGQQSLWIPVETTLIEEGFESAWEAGALQYLQDALLRNGLSEGWVKIIDVE